MTQREQERISRRTKEIINFGAVGMTAPPLLALILGATDPTTPQAMVDVIGSLGLGGLAVVMALWMVREAHWRRVEEQRDYVEDLKRVREDQLREHKELQARVDAANEQTQARYERMMEQIQQIMMARCPYAEDGQARCRMHPPDTAPPEAAKKPVARPSR